MNRSGQPSEATSASASVSAPSQPATGTSSQPEETSAADSQPELEAPSEPEPEAGLAGWELILVNGANPLPEDYQVELELITENFRADSRIVEPVKRMIAKAKEDGINLLVCSSYRSVDYQQTLVDNSVNAYMEEGKTEEEARSLTATWIAAPGTSEHHTGLALDIVTPDYQDLDYGFSKTRAFEWLDKNAHLYGFILRYPEDKVEITKIDYEPWHYRYVGEDAAGEIKGLGVCLEEYLYMKSLPVTAASQPEEDVKEPESAGEEQDSSQE